MLMGVWCQSLLKRLTCPCISAFSCWHFVNFHVLPGMDAKTPQKLLSGNSFLPICSQRTYCMNAASCDSCQSSSSIVIKKGWKLIVECVQTGGFYSLRLFCFSSDFIRTACPLEPQVVDWLQILSVDKLSISLNCVHGCINTHFIILWQWLWHNICLRKSIFSLPLCQCCQ